MTRTYKEIFAELVELGMELKEARRRNPNPPPYVATPEWLGAYLRTPEWALSLLAEAGYRGWIGQDGVLHEIEEVEREGV